MRERERERRRVGGFAGAAASGGAAATPADVESCREEGQIGRAHV